MKLKILITGLKVHDVGYRPFLIALADEFELDGIGVRNTEVDRLQAIRIKVEGDEECVREFTEAVNERRPADAAVLRIAVENYEGHVPSIERTAITNMNLQLAKGIQALGRMDTTLGRMDTTLGRIDKKMDHMLEKQDDAIEILSNMDEKMDRMLVRQDETTEAIGDIKRDDRRLSRIENDIKDIKTKIGAR